jgi:hypothetical protein
MQAPTFAYKLVHLTKLGIELARLPQAQLCFHEQLNPEQIRATYRNFTRAHPRYRLVRNKSMGIALIDLSSFSAPSAYLDSVGQRGHAGPQARKARARGYQVREIDRNQFIDEIHAINTSVDVRQGRPMDEHYLEKPRFYAPQPNFRCYGTFDGKNQLAAYCNVGFFGNFVATDQLLGYKNNDGVMYLLLADIICGLIEQSSHAYFMYDSFLGAQPGLRDFKRRIGFRPYRVSYTLAQA